MKFSPTEVSNKIIIFFEGQVFDLYLNSHQEIKLYLWKLLAGYSPEVVISMCFSVGQEKCVACVYLKQPCFSKIGEDRAKKKNSCPYLKHGAKQQQ